MDIAVSATLCSSNETVGTPVRSRVLPKMQRWTEAAMSQERDDGALTSEIELCLVCATVGRFLKLFCFRNSPRRYGTKHVHPAETRRFWTLTSPRDQHSAELLFVFGA